MAFECDESDTIYHDINVSRSIRFDTDWAIELTKENQNYIDNLANDMHERVVDEMTKKMSE